MDKVSFSSMENPINEDGAILEDVIASKDPMPTDQVEYNLLSEDIQSSPLDERELRIVDMSAEGLTLRQMGERLGISHVAIIKLKKKIRTKCEKLRYGQKTGYQN
jgi:DNA-directed RNA polymerase specialized sigma subunit